MAQSSVGLSARDMTMGYAIAQDSHRLMLPFRIPEGLAQTDLCTRMFDNFCNLYSLFMRVTQEEKFRDQMYLNQKRWMRSLLQGIKLANLPAGRETYQGYCILCGCLGQLCRRKAMQALRQYRSNFWITFRPGVRQTPRGLPGCGLST